MSNDKKAPEAKTEIKLIFKPKLKTKESNHYSQIWFAKQDVEKRTSKAGKDFFIITIEGNEIMVGTKAFIHESKDGEKMGFHIQNSREYRIFGTSEAITGKDLIQYSIQLNSFNKQQKELQEKK